MINQKRLTKTFIKLVQIDSVSGEEQKIAKELSKRLKKLGGKVVIDKRGNVIGKFPGQGEPIMLNAHMDTVEPGRGIKTVVKGDRITSDGKTILGGDDKAGIAIILETLTSLKEDKIKHLPIEVVFTVGEEVSLMGSKSLDYSKLSSKRGFVFDGEQEVARIDISSPIYTKVDLIIRGKSAHAGLNPEDGISAIQIAAHLISKLKLGRIDPETTANIGLISGGTVRNAVPDFVHIKGEIRSRNPKKLEKHVSHFREVIESIKINNPEASMETVIEKEIDGYLFSESHSMILHAKKILTQMNITPQNHHSGGLTDTNIFNAHGIEAVTIGIGAYKPHTTEEYVVISDMAASARFCEMAVKTSPVY